MDITSVFSGIGFRLWGSAARKRMETLGNEIGRLKSILGDVERRVEAEEGRHMRRTEEVNNWLGRARAMDEKVTQLRVKADEEIQKKCPTNCISSHTLEKKVTKKISKIKGLIDQVHGFDVVAHRLPPLPVDELPMETTVGLDSTFEKAWACLQDQRVGVMGLYGSGGVGKTTLLKKINNEFLTVNANADHKVDVVIWVVGSKSLELETVQEAIRAKLHIPDELWDTKGEDLRAASILKVLNTKKFVLMLDDLWEPIELSKIGVPSPDESNMCKVVFTTRSQNVCCRMKAHEFIRVDRLPPDEALNLFYNKVGEDTLKSHPDIPNLAKTIAAECQGLPLTLITIGKAMAGRRNPQEWIHAITTLQSYPARFSGMEERVFHVLRYNYESLENDAHKICFVYCSLFPEDFNIEQRDLIELWLIEGFLGEYNNVREARSQGEYIINNLKHACLLEDSDGIGIVRMHNVIRNMALWVSNDKCLVEVGDKWTERRRNARWETVQRIALWNYSGSSFTEVPNCPNLITLLIRYTLLEEFPTDFFKSMRVLRNLDLSWNVDLKKLPKTIISLTSLQHLNVEGTSIYELPIEVKQLKNLTSLTVGWQKISRKLMASLCSLQVFHRHLDEYMGMPESESRLLEREILEGLMCLDQLKSICMHIHHASNVTLLEESSKLRECIYSLTLFKVDDLRSFTTTRAWDELEYLAIRGCEELEEVRIEGTSEMQVLESFNRYLSSYASQYVKLDTLCVVGCPKIRNLTSLIYAQNLQTLDLKDCSSMEEVISDSYMEEGSEVSNMDIFSSLTSLNLEDLPSLRSICPHTLPFPSLKWIRVDECPNLKKLPLDSNTRKMEIRGEESWWNGLVWEIEATKQTFAPNFKPTKENACHGRFTDDEES